MGADLSAYGVLGLDPGADDAAIEQAYRRLIKQHHPDRSGGDAARATEINRAYAELRTARNLRDPLELNDDWALPTREGSAWIFLALLLAVATVFLLLARPPQDGLSEGLGARGAATAPAKPGSSKSGLMDQPLNALAIDRSTRDAMHLAGTSDEMALARASRDCHHLLRRNPSLVQLDRCAAFDDAVVQLQDRDPLRDQGPFSEIAVTGRIWSGASALSDDSVAIDGRLDRIRLRVERTLAPFVEAGRPSGKGD
ncbi:MAG TPA: J domain-containing protein [Sphingomicrobium sp.]|nr:J domain-containing protein [Sphingomicrobium sp.]